jgi:ABC-type branched-subunit amino acid transport system ATPase component
VLFGRPFVHAEGPGPFTRSDRDGIAQDYERMKTLFPRVRRRLAQRAGTLIDSIV